MSTVDRYKRIMQYFWDPEPSVDSASDSPIWCLGKEYKTAPKAPSATASPPLKESKSSREVPPRTVHPATPPDSTASSINSELASADSASGEEVGWPGAFLDDFEARIWLTYRSNFPIIPKSQDPKALSSMSIAVRFRSTLVEPAGFTSDTGWGCMIRSGQSLLANALVMLRLGRGKIIFCQLDGWSLTILGWRRGMQDVEERKIISLFADDPKAPYSIHKFVEHGATACGKYPGEWFGPSATARCIQ